jgi:hypothetical protein
MKVQTPGGYEYEVPESSEYAGSEPRRDEGKEDRAALANVLVFMEDRLQQLAAEVREQMTQRRLLTEDRAQVAQRLRAAEIRIDDIVAAGNRFLQIEVEFQSEPRARTTTPIETLYQARQELERLILR